MLLLTDSKFPDARTSIFTAMTQLAHEYDAINLSQGFPDFEPAAELIERVTYYLKSGKNQYPLMSGVLELRQAITNQLARDGINSDPETEITITSGATEALFCAIQAVVYPSDEVVIFDPGYDCYAPAVELAGGRVIRLALTLPHYQIDFDALAAVLSEKTRLVIINSPHNPTGSLITHEHLDQLAHVIRDYDCYVLSDEVYERITFDNAPHASVLAHPQLAARSFAVFSFGKTYHVTGWKVGYCVAPPELTAEIRKIHQFNTFTTVTPMQWALADFICEQPGYGAQLSSFYEQKRDHFRALMAASRFNLLPCHGTYFQLADYRDLPPDLSDMDDMEFARWLTIEKGVAVIPLSPFYKDPPDARIVRFCFAKQDETLEQAAEILCEI